MWGTQLQAGWLRLTTRRYRRILIASGITLLTSALLLGLILLIRWGRHHALQSDTHTVISLAGNQLVRSLQSRRGTLTFIRDTLNRRADLTFPQLQAMGASAVEHTRHLMGIGLIRADQPLVWWALPQHLLKAELAQLNRAATGRAKLRRAWQVPSTFAVTTREGRILLVMLEPLKTAADRRSAILGAFDLKPLLEDFFTSGVLQPHPAQLLDGEAVLYRSSDWRAPADANGPVIAQRDVVLDATRWRLQMQPGATRVVQALSWFNVLLIGLSLVAGGGVTVIVWILAARTWILQRAVARRTAALRRTSERLRQLATTDELTGLYNRRFFLNRWELEWERAKRYERPLACLMIDVNGFKQVNDRLGHAAGDVLLTHVAEELKTMLRQSDLLARFGGDEFVIALPETTLAQATSVAEKLRKVSIPVPDGESRGVACVTLSVGVSRIQQDSETSKEVLEAADESLYAWKRRIKLASARR